MIMPGGRLRHSTYYSVIKDEWPDVKARLSVEAGVALGWRQWVGDEGDSISIEHFGASAPGDIVLKEFGYTADNVVALALALRTRVSR
jgi:transketolase